MIKKEECILCGFTNFRMFKENIRDYEYSVGGAYSLVQCNSCGLVKQERTPSYEELINFYPEDYLAHQKPSKNFLTALKDRLYMQRACRIAGLIGGSGRVLDVGCGNCVLLTALAKVGDFELHGLDIKELNVDYEGLNIRFKEGSIESLEYPPNYFDLISLDNVVEHTPNPLVFLRKLNRIMKPSGWVVGTTPNINSVDAFLFGRYWGGYHMPRHIYLFSAETLRRMLEKTGFHKVKYPYNANPGDYCVSVQNYLRRNVKKRSSYERIWVFPYLGVMFAPVSFISSILKLNGVLDFTAQKKPL